MTEKRSEKPLQQTWRRVKSKLRALWEELTNDDGGSGGGGHRQLVLPRQPMLAPAYARVRR